MNATPSPEEMNQRIRDLEKTCAKFRAMVENANDAIFIVQDGRVRYANKKALTIAGVTADQLDKVHYSAYLHPEERDLVVQRHEQRIKGETPPNVYPVRIKNSLGKLIWCELNAVSILWEDKPATLNVIRDISSQKLFVNQALKTESLEALRTMAGGFAHNFNNLLMGIQGRISMLKKQSEWDHNAFDYLDGIESCVAEAARLNRQIEGFARVGTYKVERLRINDVAAAAAKTFQQSKKPVRLEMDLYADLWLVEGDRNQIELAIMNILLNAWQSILHSGTVVIKTRNRTLPPARPQLKNATADMAHCVALSVEDTGIGMPETVRNRVFEPFFTTKNRAKHRGLGLSSVYGIIANHNGLVDIESEPDAGTTVTMYLPAPPQLQV